MSETRKDGRGKESKKEQGELRLKIGRSL
jgi:hypothetical protein